MLADRRTTRGGSSADDVVIEIVEKCEVVTDGFDMNTCF
jgi:hypothetical protein